MSEKIDEIVDGLLSELAKDVALLEVELPSRGIGYDSGCDVVKISASNFEMEKSAAAAMTADKNFEQVNWMLERCVKGIGKVSDLYLFDKLFLALKLRQATYGNDAGGGIDCPGCGEESQINFDVSKIPLKRVPEDWEDPKEITLPKAKKKVKIFSPRVKHERYLKTPQATMDNLWRFIHSIEDYSNKEVISKVLSKLPMQDVNAIISNLISDYGLDTKIKFVCVGCGHNEIMEMPFSLDFFTES